MPKGALDLGWLRLYEAVGRHENLTRAAAELGMTQPAVSYQLRRLEEALGVALVRRLHRGAALTAEGRLLHEAVRSGVAAVDEAARAIRARARQPVVRLFTDYGFAAFWLMPRIAEFRRLQPEVEVHIVASQALRDYYDESAEINVLFGGPGDVPAGAVLIIPETVTPVASAAFAARNGPFKSAADVARAPLLHLDSGPAPRWLTFASFLAGHGVAREPQPGDLGLNTYTLVVQAALAEQGIALGWAGLVDDLLAGGALVRVGPTTLRADRGYWLVAPEPRAPATRAVVEWLTG